MVDRRLVAPGLARSQAHGQIVQRGRGLEWARRSAVGPDQNARRTVARDGVRSQVNVLHGSELLVGRQRQPELKSSGTARAVRPPAVPGSVGGFEPFNPACRQDSGRAIRILVTDASLE